MICPNDRDPSDGDSMLCPNDLGSSDGGKTSMYIDIVI